MILLFLKINLFFYKNKSKYYFLFQNVLKKRFFLISEVSMLLNPHPHLTHALSSMYEWNGIIHEKGKREGKLSPQGGGSGGGLIG